MRELLPLLPGPARWLGIEEGAAHKQLPVKTHVGLAFPDLYEVGMSYLGQKILYALLNAREGCAAERVFAPCRETGAVLRARAAPLCTLESDTPLHRLDILGFSVTHELCYTNILYMLDLGGLPLRSADRKGPGPDGRPLPLVLAGGCCTLAAEPLAPFVDVMCLGEAEESLPELLTVFEEERDRGSDRDTLLRRLAAVPGVYVPEFFQDRGGIPAARRADPSSPAEVRPSPALLAPLYADLPRPTRRIAPDLDGAPYPLLQPLPLGAVHNRLSLEIARGCTRGCRFCQAGMLYRPVRERSVDNLREIMDRCLKSTGHDDLSFLSLSSGDFSALGELFEYAADRCASEQISLSLPSLRVGSVEDGIMSRMADIRRTGATLAPEAGSERLRAVINKGITEEDLVRHARRLLEYGWRQVKLYFMIGLPTETDEDLLAILDLCRKT
ncbi:MAG: radical SAM protein, partial [Desulfovibrio sp.]|nr:radical SAM protein [Desulfovibrio sp.]